MAADLSGGDRHDVLSAGEGKGTGDDRETIDRGDVAEERDARADQIRSRVVCRPVAACSASSAARYARASTASRRIASASSASES